MITRSKVVYNIALNIHKLYNRAYSSFKIKEAGLNLLENLTHEEREAMLTFRQSLHGDNLVIYDIGAATGITSQGFAKLSNVAVIHAFEPIPEAYKILKNCSQKRPKIHAHNVALGNSEDILIMNISSNSNSSSLLPMLQTHQDEFPNIDIQSRIQVPVTRLDKYVKDRQILHPDIVKLDVQGFEKDVILGGINTIKQAKYCLIEMSFQPLYENSPTFDDMYQLLCNLGFQIIGLSKPLSGRSGTQLQVDGIFERVSI